MDLAAQREPGLHLRDRALLDLVGFDHPQLRRIVVRRTGAGRSRTSIQNFFRNGARARGLIAPGPDGVFGNADDRLIPTGETLAQVQDRVLGVGVNSSSLFTAIPGYLTVGLRGGVRFAERHELMFDFENITDRNYRGISWGLDAPGRGLFLRYNTRF